MLSYIGNFWALIMHILYGVHDRSSSIITPKSQAFYMLDLSNTIFSNSNLGFTLRLWFVFLLVIQFCYLLQLKDSLSVFNHLSSSFNSLLITFSNRAFDLWDIIKLASSTNHQMQRLQPLGMSLMKIVDLMSSPENTKLTDSTENSVWWTTVYCCLFVKKLLRNCTDKSLTP